MPSWPSEPAPCDNPEAEPPNIGAGTVSVSGNGEDPRGRQGRTHWALDRQPVPGSANRAHGAAASARRLSANGVEARHPSQATCGAAPGGRPGERVDAPAVSPRKLNGRPWRRFSPVRSATLRGGAVFPAPLPCLFGGCGPPCVQHVMTATVPGAGNPGFRLKPVAAVDLKGLGR